MKRFLQILLVILLVPRALVAQEQENGCIVCHGAESKHFSGSVHAGIDLTCVGCHGGDSAEFDAEPAHADGFRALRNPIEAIEVCAGCHSDFARMTGYGLRTDQAETYWTSAHGRGLAERNDHGVATCVTCHGSHAIFPHGDPRSPIHKFRQADTCGSCHGDAARMEPYGLDASVVSSFKSSVHGVALLQESRLASPACSDCHGSHAATPPRVELVGRVCGHCHSVVRDYFEESPHLEPSLAGEMDECVSCHSSHDITVANPEAFAGRGLGSCSTCHTAGEGTALDVAAELNAGLQGLDASIAAADAKILAAASEGLFMEREHGYLADARSLRSRTRALTHALSSDRLADLLNRGHAMVEETNESLGVKERTLRDRKIFTSIFLAVTLMLAVVLQSYRREVYGPLRVASAELETGEPAGSGPAEASPEPTPTSEDDGPGPRG